MRINFQELKVYGSKNVKCSVCGKRVPRKKVFMQTLNPFNKLPDGTVKTTNDIYSELNLSIRQWRMNPEKCKLCNESQS